MIEERHIIKFMRLLTTPRSQKPKAVFSVVRDKRRFAEKMIRR